MAAHNGMNLFLGNQTLCHSTGHIRISLGIAPDDLDGTAVNPACRINILCRKINAAQNIGCLLYTSRCV